MRCAWIGREAAQSRSRAADARTGPTPHCWDRGRTSADRRGSCCRSCPGAPRAGRTCARHRGASGSVLPEARGLLVLLAPGDRPLGCVDMGDLSAGTRRQHRRRAGIGEQVEDTGTLTRMRPSPWSIHSQCGSCSGKMPRCRKLVSRQTSMTSLRRMGQLSGTGRPCATRRSRHRPRRRRSRRPWPTRPACTPAATWPAAPAGRPRHGRNAPACGLPRYRSAGSLEATALDDGQRGPVCSGTDSLLRPVRLSCHGVGSSVWISCDATV